MSELSQRKKEILKWTIYTLLFFVAFIFQTTVDLFRVFGVKPILILPIIMFIAMFEGEWAGSLFGVIGGLFWDVVTDKLLGFNAIILLLLTVTVALLCMYLLRVNFWNSMLVILVAGLLQGLFDFLFSYVIWGHEFTYLILLYKILPTAVYTVLASVPIFFLMRKIHLTFSAE